ncbi:MAG: prepilin-type N-terminal cleavage/methylation domain-containing protein [Magnetococcales bacterium]|nr:prepilin-type N-terminal cleavage/methylation domain-containing protein [Magnetococcales bacterium]
MNNISPFQQVPGTCRIFKAHRQAGFSLIELIIFIVIISITIAGVVPMFMEALSSSFVRENIQARFLAQEVLEEIYGDVNENGSAGFDRINSTNYPGDLDLDIGANINFDRLITLGEGTLSGTTVTCDYDTAPSPSSDYGCVTVTVKVASSDSNTLAISQRVFVR